MHSQVDLMIEGVPSHVWTRDTAAELLGSGCLVESLAPETANREDLSLFKLGAWCVDPDEVPVARRLWVPEPEVEFNPAARRPTSRQLLEYKTLIHVGRVREHAGLEGWLRPPSSDGSEQSGLPDDSGSYSGSGEWRVLPWTRGARDARGGAPDHDVAGGSYRQALLGRVGPSDWRIPPMGAACPRVAMASRLVFPSPAAASPPVQTPACTRVAAEAQVPVRLGGSLAAADQMRPATENPEAVAAGHALVEPETARLSPLAQDRPLIGAQGQIPIGMREKAADLVVDVVGDTVIGAADRLARPTVVGQGQSMGIGAACELSTGLEGGHANAAQGQSCGIAEDCALVPGVETGPANAEAAAPTAAVDPLSENAKLVGVQTEVETTDERAMGQVETGGLDCMIEPAVVGATVCMDVDVNMHAPNGASDVTLPPKEQIAVANIKAFCAGLMKKLAPPLLKEIEAVRGKGPGFEYTPRHTTRSATVNAPRKSKATAAETVLLKALGITPEGLAVTDETLAQLRQMFDSPIQELQLRAIAAIFGKAIPFDLGQEVAPKVALLA
ncbi:hypothetical protein VPH35_117455 [Triticum aestivum]